MPDHQTSPVGEDADLLPCPFCGGPARIESNRDWHKLNADHDDDCILENDEPVIVYPASPGYLSRIAEEWNRRAAPALDAPGLPPLPKPVGTIYPGNYWTASVQATPPGTAISTIYTAEQVRQAQRDAVAADRRKQAALTELVEQTQELDMGYGAPTQPKAPVGASIGDDVDFHALIVDVMVAAKKFKTIKAQAEKLDALIAHIDAWAGSRAGDAVPDGWKTVPVEPTDEMRLACKHLAYADHIDEDWAAMLAAAPAPGKQAGNDQDAAV